MENLLKKAVGHKFNTQAEIREMTENLFVNSLYCLTYIMKPIVAPLGKVIDKLFGDYEEDFLFRN